MQFITNFHQAELNAAEKMRLWGFPDAIATTGGADGGIDVRSSAALAQVKWKGGVAGRPDLQRLYGARGSDTGKFMLFFAASGYSKQAVDYANQVGMALYTYDPLGEVSAVNAAGQTLMKGTSTKPRKTKLSQKEKLAVWWFLGILLSVALLILIASH